jgi:alpha-ketoglutarate-dependent taurine dioxygenase
LVPVEGARQDLEARAFFHGRVGDATDEDLINLAEAFGRIVVEPRDPRPVRAISPSREADARQNTLSSRYGFGAFPFHTDTAYRREPAALVVMYCAGPGQGDRQTLVSDARGWGLSDDESYLLTRSLWRVQREREAFLVRLGSRTLAGLQLRYDPHCMSPVGSESADAGRLVEERSTAHHVAITWSAGDLLILDNRRATHARTSALRDDPERTLKRILVHTHAS